MSRVRELHAPVTVRIIDIDFSRLTVSEARAATRAREERIRAAMVLGLRLPPDPQQGVWREETRCAHCYGELNGSNDWPCPTLIALDPPEDPPCPMT